MKMKEFGPPGGGRASLAPHLDPPMIVAITPCEHLGPIYTKRQRQYCDDASDSVLIEINGVTPEWWLQPIFKGLH